MCVCVCVCVWGGGGGVEGRQNIKSKLTLRQLLSEVVLVALPHHKKGVVGVL